MALNVKYENKTAKKNSGSEVEFGVGDRVRVTQRIKEAEKERLQTFEGIVIKIKGREENKTFTVRRIGVQQIGIERIFPLSSPMIENIEVVRRGKRGVRRAKLYFIRNQSKREIEKIYTRSKRRKLAKTVSKKKKAGNKDVKSKSKSTRKSKESKISSKKKKLVKK
jgi:large subunit ribosomal protein L19